MPSIDMMSIWGAAVFCALLFDIQPEKSHRPAIDRMWSGIRYVMSTYSKCQPLTDTNKNLTLSRDLVMQSLGGFWLDADGLVCCLLSYCKL